MIKIHSTNSQELYKREKKQSHILRYSSGINVLDHANISEDCLCMNICTHLKYKRHLYAKRKSILYSSYFQKPKCYNIYKMSQKLKEGMDI